MDDNTNVFNLTTDEALASAGLTRRRYKQLLAAGVVAWGAIIYTGIRVGKGVTYLVKNR